MKIIIIGTGNVATIMGRLLKRAEHDILQVYGRNPQHAKALAQELSAQSCSNWNALSQEAEIYLAAISDKAISEMADSVKLNHGIIAHTAGSVPSDVLKKITYDYGVIYPLQSIRRESEPVTQIPLLINGSTDVTTSKLLQLASSISSIVVQMSDEEREKLHVAAVVVNNFTNHLYALAEAYCEQEAIDFTLLHPLITETAQRLATLSPKNTLTGPAVRNDQLTIEKHLQRLQVYPELKKMYAILTESIQQRTGSNK
jgi:predicted short-subunit dehydrogenase-like oxidoreductase (DUF2520 family)